jgi:hypothetical protein
VNEQAPLPENGEGGDGRGGADRALAHAERQHVAHREPAGAAQQLRDQQQRDEPRDEEADRVQEPVVAGERDGAGDAAERRAARWSPAIATPFCGPVNMRPAA